MGRRGSGVDRGGRWGLMLGRVDEEGVMDMIGEEVREGRIVKVMREMVEGGYMERGKK